MVMSMSSHILSKSRTRIAQSIVILVSDCIEAAYIANCNKEKETEEMYANLGVLLQKMLFPIARRLDKNAMARQMVNECWWG